MRSATSLVALAALLMVPGNVRARQSTGEGTTPHMVPRAASPVRVDGVIEELAWEKAWSIDLDYEVRPAENVPPPVRTQVLVTYDDGAVYFAFRAFDPRPEEIRAHLSDRDKIGADDWVAVILDTFNDERRSFDLMVNPLGVQGDSIETATSNDEWDAIWDAAGRITDWGYAVEMRVPFSSLRFQNPDGGPQIWGFDAVRSYPRRVRHHIALFARDRNSNCYLCQAIKIQGFEGVEPGRNLEVVPTLTGIRTEGFASMTAASLPASDSETDLGLTARWSATPNITLQGTLNPDFSQVEADAVQLDVNEPFALQFAEKRPFFMEGSDFFQTRLQAVYSRTVRDPAWGAKLSGKSNGNTLGAWVVRDNTTNLLLPGPQSSSGTTLDASSTAAVLRYKRDVGNRFTLGALATGREAEDYHNGLIGFDGDFRLSGKDRLGFQVLAANTRYPIGLASAAGSTVASEIADWAGEVGYTRRTREFDAWATYRRVGKDFRADLGFVPQVGYTLADAGAGYSWTARPGGWFSYLRLAVGATDTHGEDNGLLYRDAKVRLEYEGPMQSHSFIRLVRRREAYNGSQFDQNELQLHTCLKPGRDTYTYLNIFAGDRVDYANTRLGERLRINPGIIRQIGRHLSVDLSTTWERFEVRRGKVYTATIAQSVIAYQFTTRAMLRGILQFVDHSYNTAAYTDGRESRRKTLFSQVLGSYKLNPQTVLFVGYSDAAAGNQEVSLTRTSRTFFAKLGYALMP